MALLESLPLPLGSPIIPFSLLGTDEKVYTHDTFPQAKVIVIVFTCNHCPYAQAAEPFLIELAREYHSRGVQCMAINSNDALTYPEDGIEYMKERAAEKNYPYPYLRDESQHVARAYQAQCTPDVYVYNENRTLAYHGRVNNVRKAGETAITHELQDALDALLAGQPPSPDQKPSLGCSIKWKLS